MDEIGRAINTEILNALGISESSAKSTTVVNAQSHCVLHVAQPVAGKTDSKHVSRWTNTNTVLA